MENFETRLLEEVLLIRNVPAKTKISQRGVNTGTRSGQNAVTRGQWQLAFGSEGALNTHHSGEAKSNPAALEACPCGADLEVDVDFNPE